MLMIRKIREKPDTFISPLPTDNDFFLWVSWLSSALYHHHKIGCLGDKKICHSYD